MIIKSKFDLQETIIRMQSSIRPAEYKLFTQQDESSCSKYWGIVSEEGFRVQKGFGTKHLTINGRVYEENGMVYISFWPEPNINHILILLFFSVSTVIYLIKFEWMVLVLILIISGILSLFEFMRFREEYDDFQDFIRALLK